MNLDRKKIVKHVKALLIKFVGSLVLLYIILGLMFEMTFGEVFFLTAVLGILAYLIGDMLTLPRTNNTMATIADFVLTWAIIYWFYDSMTVADNEFTASLIAAIVVGLFEIFFHRYVASNVLPNDRNDSTTTNLQYQTETADELGQDQLDENENNNNDK